ncbi:phage minor capsid protein [Acetobacterium sp.]|uniref:phage minor capsid protein n=1 Tax=Acetobacterium sp. TaxID=1872094 RepID=UPI002F40EDC2
MSFFDMFRKKPEKKIYEEPTALINGDPAEKMLYESLKKNNNKVELHLLYNEFIELYYKKRKEGDEWIEKCIDFCLKDIELYRSFGNDDKRQLRQSARREATNKNTINEMLEIGEDLVQMTTTFGCCALCAEYEGRVYSISGKNKDYPPLDIPFSGGFTNIHNGCSHSVTPYILKYDDNSDKTKEQSNRPFNITPEIIRLKEKYKKEYEQPDFNIKLLSLSRLAIIYEKQGNFKNAINICKTAISLNIENDGTKNGFSGRLKKLESKQRKMESIIKNGIA